MSTLTIVCDQAPSRDELGRLAALGNEYGKTVEVIDRHEFGRRRGWQPSQRVAQPMLYVGGEGERSVWVSCRPGSYNIIDYLDGLTVGH